MKIGLASVWGVGVLSLMLQACPSHTSVFLHTATLAHGQSFVAFPIPPTRSTVSLPAIDALSATNNECIYAAVAFAATENVPEESVTSSDLSTTAVRHVAGGYVVLSVRKIGQQANCDANDFLHSFRSGS